MNLWTALILLSSLTYVSDVSAAISVYTSEAAWLASTQWSQNTNTQTTETFDTYTTRSYISEGSTYGSQSVPIVNLNYSSSSGLSNSVSLKRIQGQVASTYSEGGNSYSFNPARVEDAGSLNSIQLPQPLGGSGKALLLYKNDYDVWDLTFSQKVRAVSFFLGDYGDGNQQSTLAIYDIHPSGFRFLRWDSSGFANQTNDMSGSQSLTNGNKVWGFLGFTTDDPNGMDGLQLNFGGDVDDNVMIDQLRFNTVPEPSTLSLLAIGLGMVLPQRRRTV